MSSSAKPKRLPWRISLSRARQRRVKRRFWPMRIGVEQLLRLVEAQRARRDAERGAHLADGLEIVAGHAGRLLSLAAVAGNLWWHISAHKRERLTFA